MKNVFLRSLTTVAVSVFCLTGCSNAGKDAGSSVKTEEVEEINEDKNEEETDSKDPASKEENTTDADGELITESDVVAEHPEENVVADPALLWESDPSQQPFYGVFISAARDSESAHDRLVSLGGNGYSAEIVYSPEWDELNPEPYYCVTAGRYETKEEAEAILEDVKKAGYKDAYVKYSGTCTVTYKTLTCMAPMEVELLDNAAIIKSSEHIALTYTFDEFYKDGNEHHFEIEPGDVLLIVDEDTVFDPSCETEFFTNYEDGDTPLEWLRKNVESIENDPDSAADMALLGIFELGTVGNRVDRFYGSYWWD